MQSTIITMRRSAAYMKMAEKAAYRLAAEGLGSGFSVGGAWRFRSSEITKWIKKQEARGV
jgi:predicted DNA-binding transcriptional regulator AlpA